VIPVSPKGCLNGCKAVLVAWLSLLNDLTCPWVLVLGFSEYLSLTLTPCSTGPVPAGDNP
jgi:hypothetical protein